MSPPPAQSDPNKDTLRPALALAERIVLALCDKARPVPVVTSIFLAGNIFAISFLLPPFAAAAPNGVTCKAR